MPYKLHAAWEAFCRRGQISVGHQRRSVESCRSQDGVVRGHYSDLELDPTLEHTHSMYPSHDHTIDSQDHRAMVVDARIINDMKSHLSEDEFWQVIEHLYAVGRAKERIPSRRPRRLGRGWHPHRNY